MVNNILLIIRDVIPISLRLLRGSLAPRFVFGGISPRTVLGSLVLPQSSRALCGSDTVVQSVCLCTSESSNHPSSASLSTLLSVLSILLSYKIVLFIFSIRWIRVIRVRLASFSISERDHLATIPNLPVRCVSHDLNSTTKVLLFRDIHNTLSPNSRHLSR